MRLTNLKNEYFCVIESLLWSQSTKGRLSVPLKPENNMLFRSIVRSYGQLAEAEALSEKEKEQSVLVLERGHCTHFRGSLCKHHCFACGT